MSDKLRRCVLRSATLLALLPAGSRAQEYFPSPAVGARGGYDTKAKTGVVGAIFTIPMDGRYEIGIGVDFRPEVGFDQFRASGDVLYRFGNWGSIYGGAGVALVQGPNPLTLDIDEEAESDFGYNLFAGYEFLRGSTQLFRPFVETRYVASGSANSIWLLAGLSIVLESGGYGSLQRIPPRRASATRCGSALVAGCHQH